MKYGGSLVGKSCKFVPDLALMSFILFFGTYSMTVSLKKFKFSRYFPTKVRDGSKIAKVKLTSPACSVENIQSREKLNVARNYIAIKKVSVRISQSCFCSPVLLPVYHSLAKPCSEQLCLLCTSDKTPRDLSLLYLLPLPYTQDFPHA